MKKLIIAILVLAMAAMSVVNCFAADISTAVTDLDLLYFEDFNNLSKFEETDYYGIEAGVDGSVLLYFAGSGHRAFELPDAVNVSGESKLTFVYSYQYETQAASRLVGVTFGTEDEDNFNYLGINDDSNLGVKIYYCPIADGTYKIDGGDERVYTYQHTTADCTAEVRYKTWNELDTTYTVVVELELGSEPVYSFYVNGEPCNFYSGTPTVKGSTYSETLTTLDGAVGFLYNGPGIYLDGVAVYKNTGHDHRELVAKIGTESGASDTPAGTEAPTDVTEAPADDVTEAPADDVTEAPADDVTEAPADDVTEAPADDVTEAPADDVTKAPADDTKAPAGDKGCGGVIGVGAIVAILGCAVVLKKRD